MARKIGIWVALALVEKQIERAIPYVSKRSQLKLRKAAKLLKQVDRLLGSIIN